MSLKRVPQPKNMHMRKVTADKDYADKIANIIDDVR